MNEARSERSILRAEVGRFTLWACFLGIFVPLVLAFVCDVGFASRSTSAPAFSGWVFVFALLAVSVAFGGPLLVYYWQLADSGISTTTARYTLYGVGILAASVMGIIVALTGGPLKSPFVFYLLYLPAITAVSFTPSKATRLEGQGVLIVAVFCALFHCVGIKWNDEAASLDSFCESPEYTAWYLLMVAIQLFSIVWIEHKSRKNADGAEAKE